MAGIDAIVDELERSYQEVQERMSDPAVYNDHREAAEVGRRLKELEEPHRLAQAWREARDDVEAARNDPELRELLADAEERLAQPGEGPPPTPAPPGPADSQDVIVRTRPGAGGGEAARPAG